MAPHKEYRARWVKAEYISEMGSAWVTPPPPPDKIRVYHLTTTAHALDDIERSRLKLSRFADLNDPFELLALSFREHHVRRQVRAFKTSQNSLTGLLCFSRNWTKPVLWSHYADRHHGICLGFDLTRSNAQLVEYQDKRILADLDRHNSDPTKIDPKLQQKLLCTKSSDWDYEEEVRVFVPLKDALVDGSMHFVPFSAELQLAEVILGPECTVPLDDVRKLTKTHHPNAVVIKSRLALKFFAVVPEESTIP